MTQELINRAVVQANLAECFWYRGLIPAEWTKVQLPAQNEDWKGVGQDHVGSFPFGVGTADSPLVTHGDASGGADTHDPRLRRVGLAAAALR